MFFVAMIRLRRNLARADLLIKFRQAYPCPLERVKAIVDVRSSSLDPSIKLACFKLRATLYLAPMNLKTDHQ